MKKTLKINYSNLSSALLIAYTQVICIVFFLLFQYSHLNECKKTHISHLLCRTRVKDVYLKIYKKFKVKNYQVHFDCCCFFLLSSSKNTFLFLGINATPIDNDMRTWNALIDGPTDTCYEDGLFTLRMEFSGKRKLIDFVFLESFRFCCLETYPLTPPLVRFTCKMFHPNGT